MKCRAFTLVELLIVVAIIAMLIAMLLPTICGVRQLTHKSTCATSLHSYGVAVASYVAFFRTYPHLGSSMMEPPWPKMNAVLEMLGFPDGGEPPHTVNGRLCYCRSESAGVWPKAYCPAMNAETIVAALKPVHRQAIGYQWNTVLRGPGSANIQRWSASLVDAAGPLAQPDDTAGIDWRLVLPDGRQYQAQAINMSELDNPATVAEAWDSYDADTVPASIWGAPEYANMTPGGHAGPQSRGGGGYALLPTGRHPGRGPNVLYADGSARADANAKPPLAGVLKDAKVTSWDDWNPTWGTMGHIVPRKSIIAP
ncbi:MAG: prepilin-type N-terminal cleavage/methylation domain-containing protein [Chloroflexi bacterium]|nr:prepilin-type N-terminal cleavage/methylation domain-containing protein [Chloroflexota bacterium]